MIIDTSKWATKENLIIAGIVVIVVLLVLAGQDGGYDPPGPGPRPDPVDGEVAGIAEEAIRRLAKEYATVSGVSAKKSRAGEFETIADMHAWEKDAFESARDQAFEDLSQATQDAIGPEDSDERFDKREAERFAKERTNGFHRAYER